MAKEVDSGPSIPLTLLREIGVEAQDPISRRDLSSRRVSRKDRRKAERTAKKSHHRAPDSKRRPGVAGRDQREHQRGGGHGGAKKPPVPQLTSKQPDNRLRPKPILRRKGASDPMLDPEPELETSSDGEEGLDEEFGDGSFEEEFEDDEEEEQPRVPKVSKIVRGKLAQDDKEIAELERKLGLKGRKSIPQSFKEDGLGDLLEDIDDLFDDEAHSNKKRRSEADEWLAQKRRKAAVASVGETLGFSEHCEDGDDIEGAEIDSEGIDEFEGFESWPDDDDGASHQQPEKPPKLTKENPYVAPTSGRNVAKYVPPSRREPAASAPGSGAEFELSSRIRRQTQGLVNRLTEANMVSILDDIEKLYREYPRQHVTSILVELLLVQICDPSNLPDTLLILAAGFATAAYRVIGTDLGAYLVGRAVDRFRDYYERSVARACQQLGVTKEASNLVNFLSQLYNFQLIGCNLIFDHIRLLLQDLSELNAELLLRIIRMSGTSLRHDDPMALKDIVALIRPALAKTGEEKISVRTRFMIETINDLKNNKMKTGASASAVVTEHTKRMRKLLGSLSSRKLNATEPLRIGLKDLEESGERGKWWLVGSSWAGVGAAKGGIAKDTKDAKPSAQNNLGAEGGQEGPSGDGFDSFWDDGTPDLAVLAKEQGMNTDVRRSIFITILSAVDFEDAYHKLLKLKLNKHQQTEIAGVLVKSVGSEQHYNPYYALVARKVCSDRRIRYAFLDNLWKLFRRLGESIFGDPGDEEEEDDADDLRRIVNVAKMYGTLVGEGVLSLQVLKCLNLVYLQSKTRAFVEVMLLTAILEVQAKPRANRGEGGKAGKEDKAVHGMFKAAGEVPDLAQGLQYFVKKYIRKSDLAGSKANIKALRHGCKIGEKVLQEALSQETTTVIT